MLFLKKTNTRNRCAKVNIQIFFTSLHKKKPAGKFFPAGFFNKADSLS